MNIQGFIELIAPLEDKGLSVSRYEGLADAFPRLVWSEWYISQDYADDRAYIEHMTIMAEFYTKTEDDPLLGELKAVCRKAELPFECDVEYDRAEKVIHYVFRMRLEEDV